MPKTDSLKLVSAIFHQFLVFAPNDSPSKTSFLSRDVQVFVILLTTLSSLKRTNGS